jgi:hypothetical protein
MAFEGLFDFEGRYHTYRWFWTVVVGFYAGLVVFTSSIISLVCWKLRQSDPSVASAVCLECIKTEVDEAKDAKPLWKSHAIAFGVAFLYLVIMVVVAVLNGLYVAGNTSIWLFFGVLLAIQAIFGAICIMTRRHPQFPRYLIAAFNWTIAASVFFLIQLPAMFDYMSQDLVWLVAICSGVPLAVQAGINYIQFSQADPSVSFKEKLQKCVRSILLYAAMLGGMVSGIIITFFFAGSCITLYGPDAPGAWVPFIFLRWNSRMMRSVLPNACPGPGPCHVYLTAGADLTSQVFINVHLPMDSAKFLTIDVDNGTLVINATEFPTPLLDRRDQRQVFSAFAGNLTAGKEHSFSLSTQAGAVGEPFYFFKTPNVSSFSYVVAGDAGVTGFTDRNMAQMAAKAPSLTVIGGDVAYDNGFLACACVWDKFLDMYESKRVEGRYLVPLTFAVGNHDIGVNDNNNGAMAPQELTCNPFHISTAKPLFYAWFPGDTVTNSAGKIEPSPVCQRGTLRYHSVGDLTTVWILDSAYVKTPEENIQYVAGTIKSGTMFNTGVYHIPLYASNPPDGWRASTNTWRFKYLQDAWVAPLFDKYSFSVCFEHHGHTYKRTVPMVGGKRREGSQKGTVYVGDGKMGVDAGVPRNSSIITPEQLDIFEKTSGAYHFSHVVVSGAARKMTVNVINQFGDTFDQFEATPSV